MPDFVIRNALYMIMFSSWVYLAMLLSMETTIESVSSVQSLKEILSLIDDVYQSMSLYEMIVDCYNSTAMSEDDRKVVAMIEERQGIIKYSIYN
jgi:hypothetical protein